ncbi:hypothetical protein [Qipengyuania nanhaisediminis]|uniref:Uncharacterized protein n=1 Tax=Qipengyuania nanhaisediminis TaxID=604088 RepID=A0A1I5KSJ9_9SPHN|nr:hypothetical protein [Qipengyuania nanhaisediminis]SFO87932.1 hypothetical protein SAMN04488060_0494 [Qipengyuania nanhaisediminis]
MRKFVPLLLVATGLSACVSAPPAPSAPPPRAPVTTPPPQQPVEVAPSSGGFIAPRVMNVPGLEGVIGKNATALANIFGPPRLEVKEGDALKLQFTGPACVLDIYLYPLSPGAQPSATYVSARRASDSLDVDRAACVAALRR